MTSSETESVRTALRAAALGSLCGLRTMIPLFLLARSLRLGSIGHKLRRVLGVGMLGELIADKLPMTPARTRALPLAGRIGAGALVATGVAFVAHTRPARRSARVSPGRPLLIAAAAGAVGALATSVAGYRLRRAVTARLGLPDFPVALAEDLICLGLASAALRRAG